MSFLSELIYKLQVEEMRCSKVDTEAEDFNPMDYFGGNFDDTFYAGESHGRASLAEELLNFIKENT